MNHLNHKPYINGWKPYEDSYVKALLSVGFDFSEVSEKLSSVNRVLKAPYRSIYAVRSRAGSGRTEYIRKRQLEIANYRLTHSTAETAKHFGCHESLVRMHYRKHIKKGH